MIRFNSLYCPKMDVCHTACDLVNYIFRCVFKNVMIAFVIYSAHIYLQCPLSRALCRIKLLPVTHVLVDTWMLTVKPVYKLLNMSDDLKWTTNTHVTPFLLTFKA